jgi:hypothetical protein
MRLRRWLRIHTKQFQVVQGIVRSAHLKRRMIAATRRYPIGAPLAPTSLSLGDVLGSGLTSVVYATSRPDVVAKIGRASFTMFREGLATEAMIAEELLSGSILRPAPILERHERFLLKTRVTAPMLQDDLIANTLSTRQVDELEAMLTEMIAFRNLHGFVLDLSPKNLCWQRGWTLVDCGPRLRPTAWDLRETPPTFREYRAHHRSKLRTGQARPSALRALTTEPDYSESPHVFLRDWWRWFPLDQRPPGPHLVTIDDETRYADGVFEARPSEWRLRGLHPGSADPHLRARALRRWVTDLPFAGPAHEGDLIVDPGADHLDERDPSVADPGAAE